MAVLEVRQWQALEAEAFSQRHAATAGATIRRGTGPGTVEVKYIAADG